MKLSLKLLALPVVAIALIGAGVLYYNAQFAEKCREPYRKDTRLTTASGKRLAAETAQDDQARDKGLSGRQCIPANQAMIFVFNKPDKYEFWMKDTRFPIDILWLDSERRVVNIVTHANPSSYPKTFSNTKPAQFVVELKAGRTQELGIQQGQTLNF